jgi:hypothetical protein
MHLRVSSVAGLGFWVFLSSVTSSFDRASTALLAYSRAGAAACNSYSASNFTFSMIVASILTMAASCSASDSCWVVTSFYLPISITYFFAFASCIYS